MVLLGAVLIAMGTPALLYVMNERILASNSLRPLRLLVQRLMPPRDLYTPLMRERLKAAEPGAVVRFEVTHHYAGMHAMGMLLGRPPPDWYPPPRSSDRRELALRLDVRVISGQAVLLHREVGREYDRFVGLIGSGLFFFTYSVPEQMPLGTPVVVEVRVLTPDSRIVDANGPVDFLIEKLSDN